MKKHLYIYLFIVLYSFLLCSCNLKPKKGSDTEFTDVPAVSESGKTDFLEMFIFRKDGTEVNEDIDDEIDIEADDCNCNDEDSDKYYIEYEGEEYIPDSLLFEYDWDMSFIDRAENKTISKHTIVDSVKNAIAYAVNDLDWESGTYSFFGGLVPIYRKSIGYKSHSDDNYIEYASQEISLEERHFPRRDAVEYKYLEEYKGKNSYEKIIEHMSLNRSSIDFFKIYTNNKKILHAVLSKKEYEEKYKHLVAGLLLAYTDLENDEDLSLTIRQIMYCHALAAESRNCESSSWFSDWSYLLMKDSISEEVDKFIDNKSSVVWIYSFWLRRANEGKMENVYLLLKALQKDYETM